MFFIYVEDLFKGSKIIFEVPVKNTLSFLLTNSFKFQGYFSILVATKKAVREERGKKSRKVPFSKSVEISKTVETSSTRGKDGDSRIPYSSFRMLRRGFERSCVYVRRSVRSEVQRGEKVSHLGAYSSSFL